MCHNTGQHHLAAGPGPAHNHALHLTAIPLRFIEAGELQTAYKPGKKV